MKPLVSIITPVRNSELTIGKTIESVLAQTYTNFEMIIVDDFSSDNTIETVQKYQKKDNRIKLFKLDKKGGASMARNFAIKNAQGKYIAFLDGDDLWKKEKLELQLNFMQDNNYSFSYTDYEYIDENNKLLNRKRVCPKKITYFRMILGDSIGCLTVMYDAEKTGLIQIEQLDKRNDYALWCKILKKLKKGYKLDKCLSLYRVGNSSNSLSSGSKFKLLKYHYRMHRKINHFGILKSSFFTFTNGINYIDNKLFRERKVK